MITISKKKGKMIHVTFPFDQLCGGVSVYCLRDYELGSSFWAAAPKGPMTYAFTQEKFLLLLLLLLLLRPSPSKLIF